MIISFCIIFLKNLSRVMRHKKFRKIQEKIKNWQNHEGSYNLGKTFWNHKKLLISSIGKKYQLCALLESGIGGLKKPAAGAARIEILYRWDPPWKCPKFSEGGICKELFWCQFTQRRKYLSYDHQFFLRFF